MTISDDPVSREEDVEKLKYRVGALPNFDTEIRGES